jgi:hypothetical protein
MHYHHHPEAGYSRKPGRVAIWTREKIIVLFAMAVWAGDVAFLINGEYPLPIIDVFLTGPVISQVSHG